MTKLMIAMSCAVLLLLVLTRPMLAQTAPSHSSQGSQSNPASSPSPSRIGHKPSPHGSLWAGTWKMDASQSKPHGPAPKEETLVIGSATGDHIKYSIHSVGENGQYNIVYEGKPDTSSPIMVDGKEAGSAIYHRVTERKYTGKGTMAIGLQTTETITLSPDNRKTTVSVHGKDNKGEYDEIMVYTR
jgi:hypothetical protein